MNSTETDKFTCAACKRTFDKGWSDEEALGQAIDKFGADLFSENITVICDDCYKEMMRKGIIPEDV